MDSLRTPAGHFHTAAVKSAGLSAAELQEAGGVNRLYVEAEYRLQDGGQTRTRVQNWDLFSLHSLFCPATTDAVLHPS